MSKKQVQIKSEVLLILRAKKIYSDYYFSYKYDIMILLIDAVKTLIHQTNEEENFEARTLNKELADYLATRSTKTIVVTNARGDRGKKIRDLMADYPFEYHSMDNVVTKNDPEYFDHLLLYYGLAEEDCFLLDHAQDNLDAAAELGIKGELYVDNAQAIELLKAL